MKNFLTFLMSLTIFSMLSTAVSAQNNTQSIIFSENFNGLSALPSGWVTYANGWSMILMGTDEAMYFDQEMVDNDLILSTPPINLANATQLTFSFKSSSAGSTLKVGTMSNPSDLASFQMLASFTLNSTYQQFTVPLTSVNATTCLSFYWEGVYFASAYLDNVEVVDNLVQNNIPAAVSGLQLNAAANGGMQFTTFWVNPALEFDGDPLTDLDSVVVAINGTHDTTFFNPGIAASMSYTRNITAAGFYQAEITPFNTAGQGTTIQSANEWIGLDIPAAPTNIVLTSSGSNATLSWNPPDSGAHGKYYDHNLTEYLVRRADGLWDTVPGNDSVVSYIVSDPGTFNYKVIPVNTSGEGLSGNSNARAFLTGNYLLWEDYWVSVPALDWTIQGNNVYNWWKFNDNAAGGTPPEMWFTQNSSTWTGVSRMVSPVLNTTGQSALTLSFRHAHEWQQNTYNFMVETTTDGGLNWHTAWVLPVSGNIPPTEQDIVISTVDVGSPTFQFALSFSGDVGNVVNMVFDEIRLRPTSGTDLYASGILMPDVIQPNDVVSPGAIIQNLSATGQSYSVSARLSNTGGLVYQSDLNQSIGLGAIDTVTFIPWTATEGEYTLVVYLSCPGDTLHTNDSLVRKLVVYDTYSRDLTVLEEATATWCVYCPSAAHGLEDLISNGKPVAVIAYHSHDAYAIPEDTLRLDFYGITGLPTVMFDGVRSFVGGSSSGSLYSDFLPIVNERMAIPSPVKLVLSNKVLNANTITAHVNIQSKSVINNSNLVLQAVLTESHIPCTWQNETELNKVTRAMFNGVSGTPINLADKIEDVDVSFVLDAGWQVPNLEMVFFVQDMETRAIFNAASQFVVGIEEPQQLRLSVYPNPATNKVRITGIPGTPGSRAILHITDITGRIVETAEVFPGSAVIDVSGIKQGLYLLSIQHNTGRFAMRLQVVH